MERKLASVQMIREVKPIKGADNIEIVRINNWDVVSQKGTFTVGDLCVYCEIDSFLPIRPEFEFLRKSSYRTMGDLVGYRLKTMKMLGQVSQGLALPVSVLNTVEVAHSGIWVVGDDVTEYLDIIKYDPPIPAEISGEVIGGFPSFIQKTDEERIQNLTDKYEEWKQLGIIFSETEKLDGTSSTFYLNENVFGICGRNWEFKRNDNTFWRVATELNIEKNLRIVNENLAIQGELIGAGIQGNPYNLKGQTINVFKIWDIDKQEYFNPEAQSHMVEVLELVSVPVISTFFMLPDTIDELLEYVQGKSELNDQTNREGSVFRSLDGKISFKAISNTFLLKSKH